MEALLLGPQHRKARPSRVRAVRKHQEGARTGTNGALTADGNEECMTFDVAPELSRDRAPSRNAQKGFSYSLNAYHSAAVE